MPTIDLDQAATNSSTMAEQALTRENHVVDVSNAITI